MKPVLSTGLTLLAIGVTLTASAQPPKNDPQALALTGEYAGTHDPSIAVDHGVYYVFATGAVPPDHAEGPPPAPPTGDTTARPASAQLPHRWSGQVR